jgi:hypothetical protein
MGNGPPSALKSQKSADQLKVRKKSLPELTGLEYVVPTERKCLFDPKVTKR